MWFRIVLNIITHLFNLTGTTLGQSGIGSNGYKVVTILLGVSPFYCVTQVKTE